MYTGNLYPPTFYYNYTTQHFPAAPGGQPRVGDFNDNPTLIPRSQYSYSFRRTGIILGCVILLFTVTLFSFELGRLYDGSNNRGLSGSNSTYSMYPSNVIGENRRFHNPKTENRWMWPWSTATLLFSILFVTAGILGIISGLRESYSLILAFFICSLLSTCLLIFLIATYSTIIAGWTTIYGTSSGDKMISFARIDRDLSIVCLSLSCALFIIYSISMILSGISLNLCIRKDFSEGENISDDIMNAKGRRFGN